MASIVEALDSDLQAMLGTKPPGVSGSRIRDITALCEKNVLNESVIIQKIFTHFKKTPGTHKLGVLYVVDSVTRKWLELAKKEGQAVNRSATDGTYAAGVNRITELLPVLMNDIILHAPQEQKEKIGKLITIWERGSTFPAQQLSSFQEKLAAKQNQVSSTPPGSPPSTLQPQQANPPKQSDASSILAALANIARQTTTAASTPGLPAQDNSGNVANPQNAYQALPASVNQGSFVPNSVNVPPGNLASLFPGAGSNSQPAPNGLPFNFPPANAMAAVSQQNPAGAGGSGAGAGNDALQNQLMIIQMLAAQGVPQDQWPQLLSVLLASQANGGALPGANNNAGNAWLPQTGVHNSNVNNSWNNGPQTAQSRDSNDYQTRSPRNRHRSGRSRSRSRSPNNWRPRDGGESPPRRRRSPTYGEYGGNSPDKRDGSDRRGRRGGRGRGNNPYRDRSPIEDRNRSESPTPDGFSRPKWIEHDSSLAPNKIRVLSRTLFVGGVTCSDSELRSIFKKFGQVQTCIVNNDKRHGFVKMISRKDSLAAKTGMESYSNPNLNLRTRWGVGFGPRDCSDYQTGISVIPIDRLTEADRKWLLTAEYGGTGGKPLVGGLVIEEPDIEIGMGVSSKAISRRMPTDQGPQGPRSSREGVKTAGSGRFRRGGNDSGGEYNGPPPGSVNAMPVNNSKSSTPPQNQSGTQANNPLAGFGLMMQNGVPMVPPGFQFPQLQPQQLQQLQQLQQQGQQQGQQQQNQ